MAFIGRNAKDKRFPEIKAAAEALKKDHKKVGAIGFCWGKSSFLFLSISPRKREQLLKVLHTNIQPSTGGWAVFQLGAKGANLVDAISTAHPSLLEKSEVDAVGVPVQILSPEHDQMYTQELKDYTNSKIPALGVEYDYQYFPGLSHGFAARGDPNDAAQNKGLIRAKNAAVNWFTEHLH